MNKGRVLEALLILAKKPLNAMEVKRNLKLKEEELEEYVKMLNDFYKKEKSLTRVYYNGRVVWIDIDEKFRERLLFFQPSLLSKSDLKTLLIIALKEPIKQSLLVKLRGNIVYKNIKQLTKKGIIQRKQYQNTFIIKTTKKFRESFDVVEGTLKERLSPFYEKLGELEKKAGEAPVRPKLQEKIKSFFKSFFQKKEK